MPAVIICPNLSWPDLHWVYKILGIPSLFWVAPLPPFCAQNSLSFAGAWTLQGVESVPCWLQCFKLARCPLGGGPFMIHAGNCWSWKNPAAWQFLTQTAAPGTYYRNPVQRHFNLLSCYLKAIAAYVVQPANHSILRLWRELGDLKVGVWMCTLHRYNVHCLRVLYILSCCLLSVHGCTLTFSLRLTFVILFRIARPRHNTAGFAVRDSLRPLSLSRCPWSNQSLEIKIKGFSSPALPLYSTPCCLVHAPHLAPAQIKSPPPPCVDGQVQSIWSTVSSRQQGCWS